MPAKKTMPPVVASIRLAHRTDPKVPQVALKKGQVVAEGELPAWAMEKAKKIGVFGGNDDGWDDGKGSGSAGDPGNSDSGSADSKAAKSKSESPENKAKKGLENK